MTTKDLVKEISYTTEITQDQIRSVLDAFVQTVRTEVSQGEKVCLTGLGSFKRKRRRTKIARDLVHKRPVVIPEHFAPVFEPSSDFKRILKSSKGMNQ